MRPVAKGPPPQPDHYPHYRDALDDLAHRIGLYCSYCEQPIQHAPEIEHVQPKSLKPKLKRNWENLLLGCSSCNRTKGRKPVSLDQVAMPDMDNTFRGLMFHENGHVEISPDLTGAQTLLMREVVKLVRLDRHPDSKNKDDRPTDRDKRVQLRRESWVAANRALARLKESGQDPLLADTIVEYASAKGFFSVWMTVFRNHPDVLKRFIKAFPGTDSECFDDKSHALPRPNGRL